MILAFNELLELKGMSLLDLVHIDIVEHLVPVALFLPLKENKHIAIRNSSNMAICKFNIYIETDVLHSLRH